MRGSLRTLISSTDEGRERLLATMQDIFAAARARVYSEPVQVGDRTIITASEVVSGGGFGFGSGMGAAPEADGATESEGAGGGAGGGGGGGSSARPVAVIIVDRDGVDIRPVYDATKVALAGITAAGVIVPMLIRMLRAGR